MGAGNMEIVTRVAEDLELQMRHYLMFSVSAVHARDKYTIFPKVMSPTSNSQNTLAQTGHKTKYRICACISRT
jgi:hypothetical protein